MSLKEKINTFPKTPGIYLMKDKENNIIYVGKSKKLQDRIKSYFVNSKSHSRKVKRMVKSIHDIEIIKTDTELDALLLECEYIKRIKPIYNVLMKNHESYSYIKIDIKKEYPYLEVVGNVDEECIYFGPYTKASKLESIVEVLNENYKLRSCKKMSKCFNYDLNKCSGPCRGVISNDDYKLKISKLIRDLNGDSKYIFELLKYSMNKEISNLNFEKAAKIKDDMDKIQSLFNKQEVINKTIDESIVFAWILLNDDFYKVYVIRRGRLLKSEVIEKSLFESLDKDKYISEYVGKETNNDNPYSSAVDKYDIDFMNIIYNYIKFNKDIKYLKKKTF